MGHLRAAQLSFVNAVLDKPIKKPAKPARGIAGLDIRLLIPAEPTLPGKESMMPVIHVVAGGC